MNDSLKSELFNLIKRHWKKAAWGSVIFLTIRFFLVAFFGWWILSTILEKQQEFTNNRETFEAIFQEKSKSFKEDFQASKASFESKQRNLKEVFEKARAKFNADFEKG